MADPARPPFYRYAAKFLLAILGAVIGATATITAAVADDRVTTQEKWSIASAIFLGLGITYGVYKVPNDYGRPERVLSPRETDRLAAVRSARRHPSPRLPPEDRQ